MGDIKTYNIGNIETAQFLYQSLDYQELTKRIAEKQKLVNLHQRLGETEEALAASAELEELNQQLEQFKENVFRLYETFTKIEINTDRLAKAKAHFDRGEFREADAILNAAEMARDLNQLIERDQQLDREKAEIEQHRTQIANEYLIKARLWATFYERGDRFEQTCTYFEEALRATRTPEIIFEYAVFLQNHNCFDQAKPLYENVLQTYRTLAQEDPPTYLPYVATTLNNLALLQSDQNELSAAVQNYEDALKIYRDLVKENQHTYLPYVATTLNNLANLQQTQNELSIAVQNYEDALKIYRDLAQKERRTYLPYVAGMLNNLAALQQAQNELSIAAQNYEDALKIYRDLAQKERRTYLPDVAMTLNNLAVLQKVQNELSAAAKKYEEALQIRRALAQENPHTYLPYLAMTLLNLSIFHLQDKPDPERSISLATEVLEIAEQFPQVPRVQAYAKTAIEVLQANGVDVDAYQ